MDIGQNKWYYITDLAFIVTQEEGENNVADSLWKQKLPH